MGLLPVGINNRIVQWRANDKQVDVFVNDCSGFTNIIAPWTASFYAKKYPIRSTAALDISIGSSSIDASRGLVTFDLTHAITDIEKGDYIYEVFLEDSYNINKITVVQDRFTILSSLNTSY